MNGIRINGKDVASGVLLLVIAATGLWLNMDHNLGNPRRMGPGYMPMLTFWVLMGLGAIVLAIGLFNGPDRLDRWAWRELALVLAAMCVFAVLLERGGLILALSGAVLVGVFADRTHRPLGVLGLLVFLLALCWWVFIDQLDIRVSVWPQYEFLSSPAPAPEATPAAPQGN